MSATNESKLGWKVLLASAIGTGLYISPLLFYTSEEFVDSYTPESQWSAGQIFYILSVMSIVACFTVPAEGYVTDRISGRKTVTISIILFGLCIFRSSFEATVNYSSIFSYTSIISIVGVIPLLLWKSTCMINSVNSA